MSDVLTEDEIIVDVSIEPVDATDSSVDNIKPTEEGKLVVILPSKWNKAALQGIATVLQSNYGDMRGVQTMLERISRYVYHMDQCDSTWEEMEASVRFLAGTRSDSGLPRGSRTTPEKVAYAFYNTLNTRALRMQCTLFNLDYTAYDSVENVVEALVAKQVEMMSTEG